MQRHCQVPPCLVVWATAPHAHHVHGSFTWFCLILVTSIKFCLPSCSACDDTYHVAQAAEKAVAQSNREISGYQVASISMTADRIAHYQQVAGGQPEGHPPPQGFDQPLPAPTMNFEAMMPHFNPGMSLPGGLPAPGLDRQLSNHQQVSLFPMQCLSWQQCVRCCPHCKSASQEGIT